MVAIFMETSFQSKTMNTTTIIPCCHIIEGPRDYWYSFKGDKFGAVYVTSHCLDKTGNKDPKPIG